MKDHTATLKQKVKKEFSHTATTVISEIEGHCENKEVGQYLRLTPLKCKVCPQMDYNHKWKNSAFVSPTVMMHLNFLNRNFSHTKKKARMRLQTMSSCDCQCLVTVMLLCVARGVVVTSCGTDFIITYNIEMLSVIVAFIFLAPDGTKRYKSVLSIT